MLTLPEHILKGLITNKTSLGKHPSFPPNEDGEFIIPIIQRTFDELSEKVDNFDYERMRDELSEIVSECMKIEKENKDSLEQICANVIVKLFNIPQDTIDLEINLVDKIDTSNDKLLPEETPDFSFDNIEDMNNLTNEIYKRRLLNVLVTGAAMFYMNNVTNQVYELFEVNTELPFLYRKFLDYNNLLMFY